MLGLYETLTKAVFVYLCICVFVYLCICICVFAHVKNLSPYHPAQLDTTIFMQMYAKTAGGTENMRLILEKKLRDFFPFFKMREAQVICHPTTHNWFHPNPLSGFLRTLTLCCQRCLHNQSIIIENSGVEKRMSN